ncbi:MAG: amidohydrolase family protein [Bacteroidota bacterium]
MRIDAHQHFWQYDPAQYTWMGEGKEKIQKDFLPPDLQPLLERAELDACVAVQARSSMEETLFLLALAKKYKFVQGVVGWVDICSPDLEKHLSELQEHALLKGFRHVVQDEPDEDFVVQEAFIHGVHTLLQEGYTYDILVYEKHFPVVVSFLEQFSTGTFILDHLGKPDLSGEMSQNWQEGVRQMARYPTLYCKLSGLVTEADWASWKYDQLAPYLEVAVEAFGTDRVMFGSDWPVCLLAADSYQQVYEIIHKFFRGFSSEEKENIFGINAVKAYNLRE